MKRQLLTLLGIAFVTGCGPSWTVRHWDVTIEVDTPAATLPWLTALPTSGARISGKTDHIAPDRIFADRRWRGQFTTFDSGDD